MSSVSQWALFVKGCALLLASPRHHSDIFAQWCARGRAGGRSFWRGQRGTWRPTRSRPVTGHHISLWAGMRTFYTPHPAREREDVQEKQSPICLKPVCAVGEGGNKCQNVKKSVTDGPYVSEEHKSKYEEYSLRWRKRLPCNNQLLTWKTMYLFFSLSPRDITLGHIHKLANQNDHFRDHISFSFRTSSHNLA